MAAAEEPAIVVADQPDRRRYEMTVDGSLAGFLDYVLTGDRIVLPYVEIDPSMGGRGLGGRLTKWALDDCRARGLKVVPECPFIIRYIREHPEYADLVA